MTREEFCKLKKERDRVAPSLFGVHTIAGVGVTAEGRIVEELNATYVREKEALEQRLKSKRAKKAKPLDSFLHACFDAEMIPRLHEWVQDDLRELDVRRAELQQAFDAAVCGDIDCTPLQQWNMVKDSNSSQYSQGYSNGTYARGALKCAEDALERAGIPYHVRSHGGMYADASWGGNVQYFELWAPLEPELLLYVLIKHGRDPLEVNREHNLNNRVLHPFDTRDPF